MKLIDEKGRLFGKVSFIDALVAAVLIVLLAGILVKNFALETTATNTQNETFHFKGKIANVGAIIADEFQVGDLVYIDSSGALYGKITEVESADAEVWTMTSDGRYVKGSSEGKVDIYITVETSGIVSNGRYLIDRVNEIAPNYQGYMHSKFVRFFCLITDVY